MPLIWPLHSLTKKFKTICAMDYHIPIPYKTDAIIFPIYLHQMKMKCLHLLFTADEKVIGSISAFRQANIHNKTAELGYYIAEEYWGKGIMTEAVKQLCEYIFTHSDIIRIYAEPFAHNIASCRVLEKSGFQYEGTLHNNALKNGKILDMKIYALLKETL